MAWVGNAMQGLLSSLAADRGALSPSLLPDIIELCLSRLHPVLIVQADCPEEVQRAFFELVPPSYLSTRHRTCLPPPAC